MDGAEVSSITPGCDDVTTMTEREICQFKLQCMMWLEVLKYLTVQTQLKKMQIFWGVTPFRLVKVTDVS
jgi:hypothetical protein